MKEVDLNYKIWFGSLKISNNIKVELLNQLGNEENIYIHRKDIEETGIKCASKFKNDINIDLNSRVINDINKKDYKIVTYLDKDYPKRLKNIDEPPYILFYKGDLERAEDTNVAIVGSRKCDPYGKRCASLIASGLGKAGIGIVSGGAFGVDTEAHKKCVEENFYNVAVFGCGINLDYPVYNRELYKKIIKNGCIISEFFPDTPPLRYNFPQRNRIISGLSEAGIFTNIGDLLNSIPFKIKKEGKCNKDGKKEENSEINQLLLSILENNILHIDDIIRVTNIDTSIIYELLCELQFENKIEVIPGDYYTKII
ncbi:DNA-processing protein DprA [Clostridium perfringens]|uniref:DNA-processing protein DprA n=1 Tax=Clostridium perfringens TaxID=1502 RepID=UPI0012426539|nr:DNA-protecting protein DprA [Clostridium perfringens]